MIYLNEKDLKIIEDLLNAHIPYEEVVVFGSRVKGNIKPHSDLDLCIMNKRPLSFQDLALLKEAFSQSDLPIRIDIVEWSTITPEFQNVIMQNHEIIQKPKPIMKSP